METYDEKQKKENHNNIAIDFDGVIHKSSKGYHDGTIYDDPLDGTKSALEFLSTFFDIIIFTCKADPTRPLVNGKTGKELVWDWLEKWNLKDFIKDVVYEKPRAKFYIDDKGITFINWDQVINEVVRYGNLSEQKKVK